MVRLAADATMWPHLRRSYRALIHKAEREYVIASDCGHTARSVLSFLMYQQLHRSLAMVPRNGETYQLQREWLLDGRALVTVAWKDPSVRGAAYWIVYKGAAYYASGAFVEDNVAHAVIWRSLLALRGLGVRNVSLGWQGIGVTEKERNIEFFKRGFGGRDVPVPVISRRCV